MFYGQRYKRVEWCFPYPPESSQVYPLFVRHCIDHCMGGARRGKAGTAADPCALALPPVVSPRKNFYGDKVLSGDHTHATVWLTPIKRHSCKTTQIFVIFCFFFKYVKRGKFSIIVRRPKAKRVSASEGPLGLDLNSGGFKGGAECIIKQVKILHEKCIVFARLISNCWIRHSLPLGPATFFWSTQQMNKIDIWPKHKQKVLPPVPWPLSPRCPPPP